MISMLDAMWLNLQRCLGLVSTKERLKTSKRYNTSNTRCIFISQPRLSLSFCFLKTRPGLWGDPLRRSAMMCNFTRSTSRMWQSTAWGEQRPGWHRPSFGKNCWKLERFGFWRGTCPKKRGGAFFERFKWFFRDGTWKCIGVSSKPLFKTILKTAAVKRADRFENHWLKTCQISAKHTQISKQTWNKKQTAKNTNMTSETTEL